MGRFSGTKFPQIFELTGLQDTLMENGQVQNHHCFSAARAVVSGADALSSSGDCRRFFQRWLCVLPFDRAPGPRV